MQFDSQLEQLREKFPNNLAERLKEIQGLYQEEQTSSQWSEALQLALHRLTGLAGTFKAHRISELSRDIEIQHLHNQVDISPETQKKIAILFQHLEQAVHQYLTEPPTTSSNKIKRLSLNLGKKLICLIEDDPVSASRIASILEENDYRVDIRQTLKSFAGFIDTSQILPSLIIVDAQLAVTENEECDILSQLKQEIENFPPIIFMSTSSDTLSRINALRSGACEYLVKPVRNFDLVNIVTKYLKNEVSHKILIIDDDMMCAEYIAHIIQTAGMQTLVLGDPLKTLEILASFKPDLLLLDINMPSCNGIELAQAIRQCCCYSMMPIIFLTTGTDIDQELLALSRGGDELIRKTESTKYLLQKILFRLRRLNQIRSLNEQLHHEQQRSERLRKSQYDFLTYVIHELKSPLHVMLGFSELLKMDANLSPEQKKIICEIIRGGKSQLAIIEDLSEQVIIATGKLALNIDKFDINSLLTQAVSDAVMIGRQSNIEIQADFDTAELIQIKADRRRVGQILNNLLSNAIKYNKPAGKVWVSTQKRSNGMLRINIADTGIGIAKEDLSYVFEAFERFSPHHHTIEGSGIGLSICSQLIGLMSGYIGVESEPNIGSQFWIELPLAQE